MKYHNNLNNSWLHNFDVEDGHHSHDCQYPKVGHQFQATRYNTMGGNHKNQHKFWKGVAPQQQRGQG
eukprot:6575963-Ditylum_brightwellii.AAC.1